MIKSYKFGFNWEGLCLFLVIMLPNFIWFAVPAPNDFLRQESITPVIDMIGSIFQVLSIAVLVCIKNINSIKIKPSSYFLIYFPVIAYYVCWHFYFLGIVSSITLFLMCVLPCISLMLFAIFKKNILAFVPLLGFTVCHFLFFIMNF